MVGFLSVVVVPCGHPHECVELHLNQPEKAIIRIIYQYIERVITLTGGVS
jgi:hypothetical protein